MAGRRETLLASAPRRGLRRCEAAAYVGVSESKFDELVRERKMPPAFRIDGCVLWDVRRLDLAFDALAGNGEKEDTWADL